MLSRCALANGCEEGVRRRIGCQRSAESGEQTVCGEIGRVRGARDIRGRRAVGIERDAERLIVSAATEKRGVNEIHGPLREQRNFHEESVGVAATVGGLQRAGGRERRRRILDSAGDVGTSGDINGDASWEARYVGAKVGDHEERKKPDC